MAFDYEEARDTLLSPIGFQFDLSADFEKHRGQGTLANVGSGLVRNAVRGFVVGLHTEAMQAIAAAQIWLSEAVNQNENGQSVGGRGGIREDLALANWIAHGSDQSVMFRQAFEFQSQYIEERLNQGDPMKHLNMDMDAAMREGFMGQCYEEAMTFYRRCYSDEPVDTAKARSERKIAYALCEFRLGRETALSETKLESICTALLKRNLPDWFDRGHYTDGALWLKLVYAEFLKVQASPIEIVMKARDFI